MLERVTAEMKLTYYGYNPSNVAIVSQTNAFTTWRLFEMCGESVFFPAVQERREAFTYTGKVVLLMDSLRFITRRSSSRTAENERSTSSTSSHIAVIKRNRWTSSRSPC
jgi:hypothetical protein